LKSRPLTIGTVSNPNGSFDVSGGIIGLASVTNAIFSLARPRSLKSLPAIAATLGIVGETPFAKRLGTFPKAANRTRAKHPANATSQGEMDRPAME
jgi:hypothetical protein